MNDGLSSNSVWDIFQDSQGFLWFGTQNGLDRFDGINFKNYQHQAKDSRSIGNNFIHCIFEDSQKRMLIGTSNGLYLFNRVEDNFKKITLPPIDSEEIKVNDVVEDNNGNIWIATHGSGLYQLDSNLTTRNHYWDDGEKGSIPMNFIWTVVCDNKGNIWLGTAGKGLAHFDIHNNHFTSTGSFSNFNIANQTVYSLYYDDNNRLWIGTAAMGLFSYNYITGESKRYLEDANDVKAIGRYSEEELIMGTDQGLTVINHESGSHEIIEINNYESSSMDHSIFSIHQDHEGAFWIGSYFHGVSYFSPSTMKFLSLQNLSKNAAQRNVVSSMIETKDGEILIGSHNSNKIYKLHTDSNEIQEVAQLEHNNILKLLADEDKLYVGVYGRGIDVLSLEDYRLLDRINIKLIEGQSMFRAANGSIYFALESGGCSVMEADGSLTNIKELAGKGIADYTEGSDGSIWIATHTFGVFRKKTNGDWCTYDSSPSKTDNKILSNRLNCIFADSQGRIWMGTKESGIGILSPEDDETNLTIDTSRGLFSNKIYSITEDKDGNFWVNTEAGIVSISADLDKIIPIGIISRAAQYNKTTLRTSRNKLYFGGNTGFIQLNPSHFVVNSASPQTAVTGFKIFNKEVLPGEPGSPLQASAVENISEITLSHNQATFSFDLVTLSYMAPEHNTYSYMLEGYDNEWHTGQETKASYSNIPPGKYTFRVRGANNDGVWSESEKSIVINIEPHFLLSPLMLALYFFLLIAITIYTLARYHKYIHAKNQEILYKQQVIQEKEMYESKFEFFTNIAHEIRTPLSLITGPLENILNSKDGNELTKKNLHTIERNANRLLELVNQLLDFRKIENNMFVLRPQNHNITSIIQRVIDQYTNTNSQKQLKIIFEDKQQCEAKVDAEAVFKIVSNLISNAVKFAVEEVQVKVSIAHKTLLLCVEDDGPGINPENQSKIFEPFYQVQVSGGYPKSGSGLGLPLAQSLAQKMGGDIYVESGNSSKTSFTLRLPLTTESTGNKTIELDHEAQEDPSHTIAYSQAETGTKVLVVEDNKELRTFLRESLSDNFTVYEAENGKEALSIIEKDSFEIIISDIVMPEMTGLELCNKLKNNPAYSHLPIILLSAKTDTLTKVDGLSKGADVYMEKPFSVEQLKAQLNSILENRAKMREVFLKSPLQFYKNATEHNENSEFIRKLNDQILENMSDEKFTIDSLSGAFAISRSNFHKKIKNITGMTPNDYIKLIRLNKSAQLLATGKYRINEVCFLVGFNTPSYFTKCFAEQFGKLPKDFIQKNIETTP